MKYVKPIKPKYHNAVAAHLKTMNWSHMLTLSKNANQINYGSGSEFEELVKTFFFRMNEKLYGNDSRSRDIVHATFIENLDTDGNGVDWHSHSLVLVEPEFFDKFANECKKQWLRLNNCGIIHLESIYDIDGISSYVAKHVDTNSLFFSCLEKKRQSSYL